MKWRASGLLVLAGAIYVAARAVEAEHPWLFYVCVTEDAAKVGAIADGFAGTAAELLDVLTENKRHHELLDAALAALDELLSRAETQAYLAGEVAKSAPLLKWLSDLFQLKLDERAALKIVEVAVQKIKEVRNSERHALRERFDVYVAGFVRRLKNDEALRERVHRLRDEALASPALAAYAGGVWDELRAWLAAEH